MCKKWQLRGGLGHTRDTEFVSCQMTLYLFLIFKTHILGSALYLCMHEVYANQQTFVDRDVARTLVCAPRMNIIDRSVNFSTRKLENIMVFLMYTVKRRGMTSKESDCHRSSVWSRRTYDELEHTKSAYDTTLMYGWNKFVFGVDTEWENLKKADWLWD
jgi:hypothetical protein